MHQPTFAREIARPLGECSVSHNVLPDEAAHQSSCPRRPGTAVSSTAACSLLPPRRRQRKRCVLKSLPRSLRHLASHQLTTTTCAHQRYGCHACSLGIRQCRAQSRNLPGKQAPSDGGAARLSGGDATALAGEGPSVRDYLEFGRLLGERPDTVKQRLEAAGGYPASDDDAKDYLRQCVTCLLQTPS